MKYERKVQLKLPLKTQNRPKKELLLLPKKTLLPSCALLIAACALSTTSTPTSAMISWGYVIATAVDFPLSLNKTRFCVVFLFWRFFSAAVAWGWKRWKVTKKSFFGCMYRFLSGFLRSCCGLWRRRSVPPKQSLLLPRLSNIFAGDSTPYVSYKGKRGHFRHDANAKTVHFKSFFHSPFLATVTVAIDNGEQNASLCPTPLIPEPTPTAGLPTPRNEKKTHLWRKKMPQMKILLHRAIWKKKARTTKMGQFFSNFIAFLFTNKNCPMPPKIPILTKKASKMPFWQHWPNALSRCCEKKDGICEKRRPTVHSWESKPVDARSLISGRTVAAWVHYVRGVQIHHKIKIASHACFPRKTTD